MRQSGKVNYIIEKKIKNGEIRIFGLTIRLFDLNKRNHSPLFVVDLYSYTYDDR